MTNAEIVCRRDRMISPVDLTLQLNHGQYTPNPEGLAEQDVGVESTVSARNMVIDCLLAFTSNIAKKLNVMRNGIQAGKLGFLRPVKGRSAMLW